MIYIWLNALPILAATLAGLAVFWTANRLYGRRSGGRATAEFLLLAFLALGWFAAILAGALILAPKAAGAWQMAVGTAVVIWAGFILPVVMVTLRYRGMPMRRVALDCLTWLMVMLVQAIVLQAIGLLPPPAA